jgi:hypothetical protein
VCHTAATRTTCTVLPINRHSTEQRFAWIATSPSSATTRLRRHRVIETRLIEHAFEGAGLACKAADRPLVGDTVDAHVRHFSLPSDELLDEVRQDRETRAGGSSS